MTKTKTTSKDFWLEQTEIPMQKVPISFVPAVMPSDLKEERRERYSVIGGVMRCLSREERKVVRAHFYHGLSWEEIPDYLKMKAAEVRHHAVTGIGKMRRAAAKLKVS